LAIAERTNLLAPKSTNVCRYSIADKYWCGRNVRYVPTADVGRTNDIDRQLNFLTGGIFHEPLMIDGLFSLGDD